MAIVKQRGNMLYIQWYDPLSKKVQSKTIGLSATESNKKKAKNYAKKLQEELTKKTRKMKEIGIQRITIKDAFEHLLRNNQMKSPKTIKDYKRFYRKFIETFDENQPCTSINKMVVEDWLNEIKQLPMAQNSIHAYGKQLTHFVNFLFEYNYTPMFKINKEVKTKPEIKEKIILTDNHIIKLFDNLNGKNDNFKICIYLLFYTGLRPTDLLTITGDKVDLTNQVIKYYSPKRKKYREIAFHDDLVLILAERIKQVGSNKIINYTTDEGIAKAIKRYMIKLNIEDKHYTARTFRKTFITLCRSRYNMDDSVVRELVGHEHQNTTDRYYNKIGLQEMKIELLKFIRPLNSK
ncbi:MAG: site-specific integrase [Ignavibacteriales bacterium]|nr:site-specific integrase [Ignavibacteriales bacterium]